MVHVPRSDVKGKGAMAWGRVWGGCGVQVNEGEGMHACMYV